MTKVLFGGPSIRGLNLYGFDQLLVCGPAACGDLLKAVEFGATEIGLVDGVFATRRSVWHKEILLALSRGIRVLGAASMGALRAAECDIFGMEGVGRIYSDYRDGLRTADSDVALLHGPREMAYRPITLPLVDAEATIANLLTCARLSPGEATALTATARQLHFTERTWRRVLESIADTEARTRIMRDLDSFKVEQKKADAQALLVAMARPRARSAETQSWAFNKTHFLVALEEELR